MMQAKYTMQPKKLTKELGQRQLILQKRIRKSQNYNDDLVAMSAHKPDFKLQPATGPLNATYTKQMPGLLERPRHHDILLTQPRNEKKSTNRIAAVP